MSSELTARLESSNIQVAAEAAEYTMFTRGICLALVRRAPEGFTSLGSSGIMTEQGLAYLIWENGQPLLSSHGARLPASAVQVESIQQFSRDLKTALGL